jgi:hypothetical protein
MAKVPDHLKYAERAHKARRKLQYERIVKELTRLGDKDLAQEVVGRFKAHLEKEKGNA